MVLDLLDDFLEARHRVAMGHDVVELRAHLGPVRLDLGYPGKLLAIVNRPVAVDGEGGDNRLDEIPEKDAQFCAGMLGREAPMAAGVFLPGLQAVAGGNGRNR